MWAPSPITYTQQVKLHLEMSRDYILELLDTSSVTITVAPSLTRGHTSLMQPPTHAPEGQKHVHVEQQLQGLPINLKIHRNY